MEHIKRLTRKRTKDVHGSSGFLQSQANDVFITYFGYIPIELCQDHCEGSAPPDGTCVRGGDSC